MKHSWAKKVLVLLRLDIMPGRQELIGIFRYMKQKGCDWDIRLMSPFEVSPEVFSETGSGHFNGVINAETLERRAALLEDGRLKRQRRPWQRQDCPLYPWTPPRYF